RVTYCSVEQNPCVMHPHSVAGLRGRAIALLKYVVADAVGLNLADWQNPFDSLVAGCYLLFESRPGLGVEKGLVNNKLLGLGTPAVNPDVHNLVATLYLVNNILPLDNPAEDSVLAIKPGSFDVRNEELAAVRVGAGVGHRQNAGAAVLQAWIELVRKAVPGSTGAGAERVSTLDHEIGNYPVKCQPVEKGLPGADI